MLEETCCPRGSPCQALPSGREPGSRGLSRCGRCKSPSQLHLSATRLEDLLEDAKQAVALLLLQADDPAGEAWVDIERLGASDGMAANERVDVLDRLTLDGVFAVKSGCAAGLLVARVFNLKRLEVGAERGRQAVVRLDLVEEERVAAGSGRVEQEERGQAGRLQLVRDVPGRGEVSVSRKNVL